MRKLRMSELERLAPEEFKAIEKFPFSLYLDEVRSILNVGSIFRSADAFRCSKIYLAGLSPTPNKEMHKTALGATEVMDWEKVDKEDNINSLFSGEVQIWGLEQTTESISLEDWKPDLGKHQVLVMGNEVSGVRQSVLEQCTGTVEIPQFGTKHSLNVSVSAGILMWSLIEKILHKR